MFVIKFPTFKLIFLTGNPQHTAANKLQTETNNMASVDFSDDSSDTNFTQTSMDGSAQTIFDFNERLSEERTIPYTEENINVVNKLINRQVSKLTYKSESGSLLNWLLF